MKIYNSVTIDMTTLKVIHEDSYEYEGPIIECKGGGGNAGKVGFAQYIEDFHDPMMGAFNASDSDVGEIITAAQGSNPYDSVSAYNPNQLIGEARTRINVIDTIVKALDEHTDWDTIRDNVKEQIDSQITDAYVDDLVAAYEEDVKDDYAKEVNTFAPQMSEINAVNSSAFILGMANITRQKRKSVDKYRASLIADLERTKQNLYNEGTAQMFQILNMKISSHQAITSLLLESNRLAYVMKSEQYQADIELDRTEAVWDFDVLNYAGSLLGAPGGGSYVPEKPSKLASGASGALSGAATGAAIGSVVPGLGTAVGAGVGAVVGLIGGLG